ncbi:MAG: hypothetical protein AAF358_23735 [Pseudomonadota bacterium]
MKKDLSVLAVISAIALPTAALSGGTTIVVDWAIDEEPGSNTHTCTYAQGGLFQPDTTGPGAGRCTFRRALREAGARPTSDQPISIVFTGLEVNGDGDDGSFDGTLGVWTLEMSDSASQSRLAIEGQSILDVSGNVTIDGGPQVNGGPAIFVDTEFPIEIEKQNNTIRRMGFFGGGSIQLKESGNIFEDNTWGLSQDGNSIMFADPVGNADNLAGAQGVNVTRDGNNATIRNNVLSGASTRAIEVNSMASGAQILNNFIGTRRDGTVPARPPAVECQAIGPFNVPPDPQDWYGGWGISLAGTGAVIEGNTLAGMQNLRSTNDTPPIAVEIFGASHTVQMNIVGEDSANSPAGTCGQGIKFSGDSHQIVDNMMVRVRAGFENTDGALLWTDDTFTDEGGNTVRRNLSIDGPEKLYEMGPQIGTVIRTFEAAEILTINGLNVTGGAGAGSPCPNCIIDFYLDDTDTNAEALAYLGSATANGSGDFTFTLPSNIGGGQGIRTTSTSQADNVIPGTLAGTTSEPSELFVPILPEVIFTNGFEE